MNIDEKSTTNASEKSKDELELREKVEKKEVSFFDEILKAQQAAEKAVKKAVHRK